MTTPPDVLAFWRAAGPDRWYEQGRRRSTPKSARGFSATYEAAAAGELSGWEHTAESALALLIVLDQFPRNMFRGRSARLTRPIRWPARSPIARIARDSTSRCDAGERPLLLPAVRAFGGDGGPGALPRTPSRAGRCRFGEMGRIARRHHSRASGAFLTAMPCSAAQPRRTSRHSSMPADSRADYFRAGRPSLAQ